MSAQELTSNVSKDSQSTLAPLAAQHRSVPFWEYTALLLVMSLAAGLRLWGLDRNGMGNPYYSAAVRSMLISWSNFFYGSFDPTGFVTVDKPPVALWVQAISAKLLGYSGLSLLLPQAIMGTTTVGLIYLLVRRVFGGASALVAALTLAMTPISVAVDRDNLPDSLLTLVLVLAAGSLMRAAETGRCSWLLACVTLVGVGFNVKMMAAFVVLPTFYAVYFFAAPVNWLTRLSRLSVATGLLVLVSLSWCLIVEATPKASRPYIGGSKNNSGLELALGYNRFGRIFGGSGNMGPPGGIRGGPSGGGRRNSKTANTDDRVSPTTGSKSEDRPTAVAPPMGAGLPNIGNFPPGRPGLSFDGPSGGGMGVGFSGMGGRGFGPPGFGGTPGFLRFTGVVLAEQITWLFPVALIGALASFLQSGWNRQLSPGQIALVTWLGWWGTHWIVFSFAQGIFHDYYTIVLGPAVAALAGIGTISLVRTLRSTDWRSSLLPSAILTTGAWQTFLIAQYAEFRYSIVPAVLGTVCFATALVVSRGALSLRWPRIAWGSVGGGLGLASLYLGPAMWSLGATMSPVVPIMPLASPAAFTAEQSQRFQMPFLEMDPEEMKTLSNFLRANRHGEKYLVAAAASMEVASLIIHTGDPAISLGGFMGADPVMTKDQFVAIVKKGELRFVMSGGGPGGPGGPPPFTLPGGILPVGLGALLPSLPASGGPVPSGPGGPLGMGSSEIMTWVHSNGKLVDANLWRHEETPTEGSSKRSRRMSGMGGGRQLYDLHPEAGLMTVTTTENDVLPKSNHD